MAGEESSPGVFSRIHGKASLPGVGRRHTAEKSETPFAASLTARFLRRVLVPTIQQRVWKGHIIVFSLPSPVETHTRQRPKKPRHRFCLCRVFFINYTANKKGSHVIAICLSGVTCYYTRQSPMGRLRQALFAGYRGLGDMANVSPQGVFPWDARQRYLRRVFFPEIPGKKDWEHNGIAPVFSHIPAFHTQICI
jgi:hypothetical protein